MMQQMREHMKVIMVVTALAFVGLMVFGWGMDITGRSSSQITGGELGRVNSEPITYEQFSILYNNLVNQQQQAQPDEQLSLAQSRQLENQAWDQLVTERLIGQELRRRDITVTDFEVRQAARFAPPPEFRDNELFLTNGEFDLQKYHQFLASPGIDQQLLLQLEAYYRDMIPRNKLFQQIMTGFYVSDGELWRMWRETHDSARVRYLAIDPSVVVTERSVDVTDREVESYYKAHQDEFKRAGRATVRLVSIDRTPTAADTAAARARALRLREEILGGADFGAVAQRESADPGSAPQGGSLGSFARGQNVPAFDQAVWATPLGRVSEPVLTQFGYHLIQVEKRTDTEATARHILIRIEPTPETEEQLLTRADSLEDLGERMPLTSAAERLGMRVREVTLNQDLPFVPGLGRLDEGADWAIRQAAPGEVSELFETRDAFYVLELIDSAPAGVLPLAEAQATIRAKLIAQKKLARARELGNQILGTIRSGQPLDVVGRARGLEPVDVGPFTRLDFVPGVGRANAAVGTAFGLQPGQVSGVVESEGLLYIMQSMGRTDAKKADWEAQKEQQRAQVMSYLAQQRLNDFLVSLKERATIIDNRERILRPTREELEQFQQQQRQLAQ